MDGRADLDGTIEVSVPVSQDTARLLTDPARRQAAGRYLDLMLRGGDNAVMLADAIWETKREAQANGLTDEIVDAELEAWRAERHG